MEQHSTSPGGEDNAGTLVVKLAADHQTLTWECSRRTSKQRPALASDDYYGSLSGAQCDPGALRRMGYSREGGGGSNRESKIAVLNFFFIHFSTVGYTNYTSISVALFAQQVYTTKKYSQIYETYIHCDLIFQIQVIFSHSKHMS